MASSMALIAKRSLPQAVQVTDRFHVQRLAAEALQQVRIEHRWQVLEAENEAIEHARQTGTDKLYGLTRLGKWHDQVGQAGQNSFQTVSRSIEQHYVPIMHYFANRSTTASVESFIAKIKAFRSQFRGFRNVEFFLYRLSRLYA